MRRLCGRVLVVLAASALVLSPVSPGGGVAHADEGLRWENTTTYVLDSAAGVVHATIDLTLTNELSNERDGNTIIQPYFTDVTLPIPADASNIVATGNGSALAVELTPVEGTEYASLNIDYPNLFAGESLQVHATFDLTGQAPRSDYLSRINPAYAAFAAYGVGDEGLTNVRIVIPKEYEAESFGDEVIESEEDGNRVLSAVGISNPDDWFVFVSARNDAALASTSGQAGAIPFEVQAWPGDDEWAQFVNTTVTSGLPVLEGLIGQPWPLEETLQVRETITPYFYGYGGWFDASTGQIEIGEDLDQELVLHELSHAWFNSDLFTDRWVNEGMAQNYAARGVAQLNSPQPEPESVDVTAAGYVPLADWNVPPVDEEDAREMEDYAYNASWSVIDGLADEVGPEKMAAILAAADAGTIAYAGDAPVPASDVPVDWQTLLDLAEEVGGSTTFEPAVRGLVVAPGDTAELDARAAARTAYDALEAAGGAWTPPLGVRAAMADWDFDLASTSIQVASAVLTSRNDLTQRAAALDLVPPAATEAAYEEAADDSGGASDALTSVQTIIDDQLAALQQIAEVDGLHDEAVAGFAAAGLETDLEPIVAPPREAFEAGDVADMTTLTDAAATELNAWIETGAELDAAAQAEAADRGFFESIGLRGTDLEGDLDAARKAFAEGDRERAAQIAAEVQQTLADANSAGKKRVLIAASIVVAALLLITLLITLLIRRKRRRRRAAANADRESDAAVGAVWGAPQGAASHSQSPLGGVVGGVEELDGDLVEGDVAGRAEGGQHGEEGEPAITGREHEGHE